MARRVFVSFRYSDGHWYKERLERLFDSSTEIINCSEDVNRSGQSDFTIQNYLYSKLRSTSVTIVLLTPNALSHRKDYFGGYDDWMYDEIRYSLEDRENNRCNGLIAVYTPEAANMVVKPSSDLTTILDFDNLVRANMLNIKPSYKKNPKPGIYDSNYDSYCSCISWANFINNYAYYIDIAAQKREVAYKYDLVKRLQTVNPYSSLFR
ncbi:MTH538 TIR-like domain [Pseudobutyrivibrio sp. UC1225]|uniref:TIR domain-containing protein n=1 Tax=Pseudobutyrivibrio sp. UC1225 TaxID=1798185 RepID=UPI0008EBE933|nr:TIR domain-containing protein [Pseudobutyrivibrio sp. UC1225]SFO34016.1 MTH538 TIR-like domain [Pseudobutyrivibrio sp. UC1225]